jgi:hypothetical protein
VVVVIDQNGDGFLNYREFAQEFSIAALRPSEPSQPRQLKQRIKKGVNSGGILSGLAALASSTPSRPNDNGTSGSDAVKTTNKMNYAQLAALGSLFLLSGGNAQFHGDNRVSTRPGYRPTVAPRGVMLAKG